MCCAELANTTLVSKTNENGSKTTSDGKTFEDASPSPKFSRRGTPPSQKIGPYDLSCIRENLTKKSLSTDSQDIILASWRKGTSKQYHTYIKKRTEFCSSRGIHYQEASIEVGIEFLTSLYKSGIEYSAINTARSALLIIMLEINGKTSGQQALVKRFIKGIFELRPMFPKYSRIWDVNQVLNYLKSMGSSVSISFKMFTLRLNYRY